jgi:hypothetical protein
MFLKKRKIILLSALALFFTNVFAGPEDWTGTFFVKAINGSEFTVVHTPKQVKFMFFTVGSCLVFGKDSTINGLRMPQDVSLCTKYSIQEFTAEVEKFSTILDKNIEVGPDYTSK